MQIDTNWIKSIYSDGSENYISNPNPRLGEVVKVRLRIFSNAPIIKVLLRHMSNGTDVNTPMQASETSGIFTNYTCELRISQPQTNYHFIIGTTIDTYYYNQLEVTSFPPVEDYDFRIIAGYESPEWVKRSVFYQIFPDRFYNGDPDNDVQDNEYIFNGHSTTKRRWCDKVAEYSEAFCLDFYGGDLEGIKKKISYLNELGVNALYLTPIFHAATHHKYDCMDYFNVDPYFGGNKALEELVEELHQNGIRIILDVSINHTGIAHKWFNKDGDFFPQAEGAYNNPESVEREYYFFDDYNKYHAWFGIETLPTLNYTSEKLKEIIYKAEDSLIKLWLKPPYNIDGWRFDVGFCMARMNELQMHREVWNDIRNSIKSVNTQAYILAEHWTDNKEFLDGNLWDASMNYFGFGRPVRQFLGEPDEFIKRLGCYGLVSVKRKAEDVAKMFMQHIARLPYQISLVQYNMYDSHDIARLHNNSDISYESWRTAVIMQFTFPGVPGIYYGDEIRLNGHIETVEGCRYPMEWNEDMQNKDSFNMHRILAILKRKEKALQTGGFKVLYAQNYVVSYSRFTNEKAYIVVCSQELCPVTVDIPTDIIGAIECSVVKEVFNRSATYSLGKGVLNVLIKPQESLLFEVLLQ